MARPLKLAQQNLLMFGIPLTFQIVFVLFLFNALNDLEKQYNHESHLRMMMGAVNGLLNQMMSAAAAEGMYQTTQNKPFRKLFLAGYAESARQSAALKKLLDQDPSQNADLNLIRELIDEMNLTFGVSSRAMESGNFADMLDSIKQSRNLIEKAQKVSSQTVRQMENESAENKLRQEKTLHSLTIIIIAGVLLNTTITLAFLRYFVSANQRRFNVLSDNINALSMARPLRQPLEGEDEVARLDYLLHQVSVNMEHARLKEQAMIDNALDVICSLDKTFRFQQANNAVNKQFAIEKEDIIGKSLTSLVLPEDREKTVRELETVIAQKTEASFENRVKMPDGRTKDMLWNVVYSGEEQNLFCVAHDISGRKEVERLKQEVIAVVSHDLRAPLTSLGLTLNVLAEGGLGPLSEKAQSRIAKAEASVTQLISIINDLIDIEKFESGAISMDYKIFEGTELISEAISTIESSAAAKGITIQTSQKFVKVICDGQRVVRVLTNLLSNAIKFSPNNSTIYVTCEEGANASCFSVIDQGRGIAEDKIAVIFERWKQVEKEDETQKGGSGLGLAICKALIDAHGGRIEAVSNQSTSQASSQSAAQNRGGAPGANTGSTFRFYLPNKPPKTNA
jgi:PAS domain S-box-containing protein